MDLRLMVEVVGEIATRRGAFQQEGLEPTDSGFVDEVRALCTRPRGLSRTARQALGYRELLAHVEEGVPLQDAVDRAVSRTRRFARRQRVWFRRDPRISWYAPEGGEPNPLAVVPALLGDWERCRSSA